MKEIVIFDDWMFFQCIHHIGKLGLVDSLPYDCVILEDLLSEETSYSKQEQLLEDLKSLSNIRIDKPKKLRNDEFYISVLSEKLFYRSEISEVPEIFGKIESLLDNQSDNNEITHNEDFYKEHSVLPLDYQHAQLLGVEYEKVNPDTSIEVCAKMEDIIDLLMDIYPIKTKYSQTFLYRLVRAHLINKAEIDEIISLIMTEQLCDEEKFKFLGLLYVGVTD